MFDLLKRLKNWKYKARVLLSRSGGQPETIDVAGRPTVLMHAGEGMPFVYLHSALGEAALWLPYYQAWARSFRVLVPTHPGFGQSGGFEQIDTIEDMAFHYVEMFDALGLEEVILGGVSLGGRGHYGDVEGDLAASVVAHLGVQGGLRRPAAEELRLPLLLHGRRRQGGRCRADGGGGRRCFSHWRT